MNTATAAKSLTTLGQAVEVEVTDFSEAGFAAGLPKIWVRGTVVRSDSIGSQGHTDIDVLTVLGTHEPRVIGRRGGNKTIRLA